MAKSRTDLTYYQDTQTLVGQRKRELVDKDSRIIIIKIGHDSIGIMVDSVKEVVNIDVNTVEKVGFENRDDSTFVQGIGKQENGALISLLDLNAVLSE